VFGRGRAVVRSVRVGSREIRTDFFPAVTLIAATQQILRTEIQRVRVLGREDQRRSPGKAVLGFRGIAAKSSYCRRRDDLFLAGSLVISKQLAEGSPTVADIWIAGIGRHVAALACAARMPVAEGDRPVVAAAGRFHATAVLLRAVDVV